MGNSYKGQRRRKSLYLESALAVLVLWSTGVCAEDVVLSDNHKDWANKYTIDAQLPDVPAYTVIGSKSDGVVGSATGPDWYVHVAQDGNNGAALGLNFRPAWTLGLQSMESFEDYINHPRDIKSVLMRTQVSIASNHNKAGQPLLGVGLQTSLFGNRDPRLDSAYVSCLDKPVESATWLVIPAANAAAFRQKLEAKIAAEPSLAPQKDQLLNIVTQHSSGEINVNALGNALLGAVSGDKRPQLSAIFEDAWSGLSASKWEAPNTRQACIKALKERLATKRDVYFGLGQAWQSTDTSYGNLKDQGASYWMGYDTPVGDKGLATFYARSIPNQKIEYAAGAIATARTTILAVKYEYKSDDWAVSGAISHNDMSFKGSVSDISFQRYSLKLSHKFTDKIWVNIETGETSKALYKDGSYSIVSLKLYE